MPDALHHLRYKRSRFSTRLPLERRYTAGHVWLWDQGDDPWRIGLTKFSLRMLGEPVELDFEVEVGDVLETGQIVGWIEGFKAVSDFFCPMTGTFAGGNPALDEDIAKIQTSPYEEGWIYQVQGRPSPEAVDAQGYSDLLDETIDRMLKGTP